MPITPEHLSLLKQEGIEAGKALEETALLLLAAGTTPMALAAALCGALTAVVEALPSTQRISMRDGCVWMLTTKIT